MNNRQNGRRRGRGGQPPRGGQPGSGGSRLDNRARGNAAQLLEKYKTLARDAQMQGDRVNTEYYLQFADHYFRVLSENRARFEEQRPRPADPRGDFDGDDDGAEGQPQRGAYGDDRWDDGDEGAGEQPQRAPRAEREPRQPRERNGERGADRAAEGERDGERSERGEGRRERGRRNGANGNHAPVGQGEGEDAEPRGFAPDFISQRIEQPANPQLEQDVAEASEEGEDAPKPRRRPRRPRAETVAEA